MLAGLALPSLLGRPAWGAPPRHGHYLYVAVPGIRNYVEWGGVGILVYDVRDGFRLVRRIPTLPEVAGKEPEPIKGVCASARTGRLYASTKKGDASGTSASSSSAASSTAASTSTTTTTTSAPAAPASSGSGTSGGGSSGGSST